MARRISTGPAPGCRRTPSRPSSSEPAAPICSLLPYVLLDHHLAFQEPGGSDIDGVKLVAPLWGKAEVRHQLGVRVFHVPQVAERPAHRFDVSCQGTVPLALSIAVRSGSFDEMLRWCSMGGDADTLAAIAGPVAEPLYGIPAHHLENARMRFHPMNDIWEAVERVYAHTQVKARLVRCGRPPTQDACRRWSDTDQRSGRHKTNPRTQATVAHTTKVNRLTSTQVISSPFPA